MSATRRPPRILALSLAFVVAGGALAAIPRAPFAQTTAPEKPGTLADAKVHMDKGQELYLAKEFAKAAEEFHTAYEIKPFSSFVYNEAVCHEKLGDRAEAIRLFQKYLDVDPTSPDRDKVQTRIVRLKQELAEATADAGVADAESTEAGATDAAAASSDAGPPPLPVIASLDEMRSIVVVESEPSGAPAELWNKIDANAKTFEMGGANPGWKKVASGTTTMLESLPLGVYHIVIPKFQDFRATETDVIVAAATLSQFKANLSQGSFFGVLKVRAFSDAGEVRGAHVLVKKPGAAKFEERGLTPYEESFEGGVYGVRVEQPGFQPLEKQLEVKHGALDDQRFELERSEDGTVRVVVTGTYAAEVFVDERSAGKWSEGEDVDATVKAGTHKVRVEADDRKTLVYDVEVPKGRLVVVHADLKPSVSRTSAWTTAVASALFLGGGIYLGATSRSLKHDLDDAKNAGRLDQNDPRIKRGQFFAIGADACFGIAAIVGLVSVYNFVKDPLPDSVGRAEKPRDLDAPAPPTSKTSVSFSPTFGAHVAGLSLVGEF